MADEVEGRVWVPDGDSRKETAILLVGTADEYDIPQREIKARPGGFDIPAELAEVLYDKGTKKKTSGSRAAKNKNSKEE